MNIGITGGRDYTDHAHVWQVLDNILYTNPNINIIVGDAKGVDAFAREWATERKVPVLIFYANWDLHGRSAGPIRNKRMLDHGIDLLLSFKGGRGTAHMTKITKDKGIEVRMV
jgi:YspA, cpYpsA-related SLOG family